MRPRKDRSRHSLDSIKTGNRMKSSKHNIDKENIPPICRSCGEWGEALAYLVS